MSLDERMRAGTRAAAGSRSIDRTAAWEQVQQRSHRAHTRRNVLLVAAAAAAGVAGVVWGPGIVDSLSGQREVAPVDQPTEEAVVEDGTGVRAGAEPNVGTPVQPGSYTYTGTPTTVGGLGPFPAAFPYTFTTEVTTLDGSSGGGLYGRQVLGDPYGALEFDFPVAVADLTQPVTDEESATAGRADENLLYAGPIDVPSDIAAWLGGAVSLDVVDNGTLSLAGGQAQWWDVEISDPAAACFPDTTSDDPPCVLLWPPSDGQDDPQIGLGVQDAARIYAIQTDTGPLMAMAHLRGGPHDQTAGWLATTDQIVSSITLD
jgi:hypothetical protein